MSNSATETAVVTVLCIDPNMVDALLLAEVTEFHPTPVRVLISSDVTGALKQLHRENVNLILLSPNLPAALGVDVIQTLSAHAPIWAWGGGRVSDRAAVLAMGAVRSVDKPQEMDGYLQLLRDVESDVKSRRAR